MRLQPVEWGHLHPHDALVASDKFLLNSIEMKRNIPVTCNISKTIEIHSQTFRYNLLNAHLRGKGCIQHLYHHFLRPTLCDSWIRSGPIVCRRCSRVPPSSISARLLSFPCSPLFSSFYRAQSLLFCPSVMLLSPSPCVCHNFVHERNQYSRGVTHTSTAASRRRMKGGRSGARHAAAPQATPAWQVIHLLDLNARNEGHIPVVPPSSSSLSEEPAAESSSSRWIWTFLWLMVTPGPARPGGSGIKILQELHAGEKEKKKKKEGLLSPSLLLNWWWSI